MSELPFGYHNCDCMELMRSLPDKCIDLAIVDPPYGDGGGTWKSIDKSRFGERFDRYKLHECAEQGVNGRKNTVKKS